MTDTEATGLDAYWEVLDGQMTQESPCPGCQQVNRFGDMIDRSRFKTVSKGGIRCKKIWLRLECPGCGFLYRADPGFLPLTRAGHLDSPIETWRRHRGLPSLSKRTQQSPPATRSAPAA